MISYKKAIRIVECIISDKNFLSPGKCSIPIDAAENYISELRRFEKLGLIKISYNGKSYDPKIKSFIPYVVEITNDGWYIFGKYFTQEIKSETKDGREFQNVRCKMPFRFHLYYYWLCFKSLSISYKKLWIISIIAFVISNWTEFKNFISFVSATIK